MAHSIVEEHKIETRYSVQQYHVEDIDIDINDLNQLGRDGWELVPIRMDNKLYFRRQLVSFKDKD